VHGADVNERAQFQRGNSNVRHRTKNKGMLAPIERPQRVSLGAAGNEAPVTRYIAADLARAPSRRGKFCGVARSGAPEAGLVLSRLCCGRA
jgi:hypothetical protein